MRIHLNLPSASLGASSSAQTLDAPEQITALGPNGELLLIELQGSLEIENQCQEGNQVLGTMTFDSGREDRPILMVSHHRLEGKFVNLVKPLAVLEKKTRTDHAVLRERDPNKTPTKNGKRSAIDSGPETTTPTSTIKKARHAEEAPASSPALATPIRNRKQTIDFSSSPPYLSSPVQTRDGAASAVDEEQNVEDLEQDELQTAVYYDVVNIIKRKILFSKRPEPIVKLGADVVTPVSTAKASTSKSRP